MRLNLLFLFLFSACVGVIAEAQSNPFGRLAVTEFPQPYMLLIRDEVVHDDLKLDANQRDSVRKLTDELDVAIWSMRNKTRDHIGKAMTASLTKAKSTMSTILSPEQARRMDQIVLWTLGMKSLDRDSVAKKLSLTSDQRNEIAETLATTAESLDDLRQQVKSGASRESAEKKNGALRTEEREKIFAILSRRQRQELVAVLGRRLDVSALGRVRFKAPEIVGDNPWFNSPPLTLEKLKGKVVALHFFAFA